MTVTLLYNNIPVLNSVATPSKAARPAFILAANALNSGAEWQRAIGDLIPFTAVSGLGTVINYIGTQGVAVTDEYPWSVNFS